jgi:ribosomal protein S18 acetylase RimI-like enzyme
MIRISRVRSATKSDLADVNNLLRQLSGSARILDMKAYRRMLSNKSYLLFVARDGRRIVGMVSLILMEIPVAFRTRMEDMVVDEAYRGQGIGQKLSRVIIAAAKKNGGASMDLTTRPGRSSAHKLYEKLGFKKRDTDVYRLGLV